MKNIKKYIGILVLVFMVSLVYSQTPPPPNNNNTSSGGTTPVGGGAPIGGGLMVLIAAAGAYGYTKRASQITFKKMKNL